MLFELRIDSGDYFFCSCSSDSERSAGNSCFRNSLSAANALCGLVEEVAWIEDTKKATMMPTQQEKKPHTVNC